MDVAIPLFDRITALDAVGPYEVLSRVPGARVVFVGERTGVYRSEQNALGLVADATLEEMASPDVVVVPGGMGTRALLGGGPLVEWIRRVHATTEWTTSVCTGSLLLGAAGLLRGLEATTHWASLDLLPGFGAVPVERRVVEQGKVITAAGVSAGIDMALLLAARLAGDEVAQLIQLSIEYDPQPPFDAGSLQSAPPEIVARAQAIRARRAAAG